jgi:putative salt-induced outer membrane protein
MKLRQHAWLSLALAPLLAAADPPPPPPPPMGVWTGKGQVGFVDSQGNTDARSANGALDMDYYDGPWKHSAHVAGLYGENSGIVAAEFWDAQWQSNYDITSTVFTFGGLRYDHDLFSGFEYQASASAGAGYKLINTAATKLSAQVGVGYRSLRPEELTKDPSGAVVARTLEERSGGVVGTGGVDYSQALTSTTTLTDKFLAESGSNDSLFSNALALSVKMSVKLALSLGYSLQDNTKPPPGLKKLDSVETINLVYGF